MNRVLLVDDEKAILRSLMRLFYRTDWKLYFAENGLEALEVLARESIDMVISDIRMPDMDGHKLLQEVQQKYPDTIRLILSGYSNEREVYMVILDGAAKSYLMKPWEPDRLLAYLQNIFEQRNILQTKNLFEHFAGMRVLPTFRSTVDEINRIIKADSNSAQIAPIIEADPGISARLLQLVNSASHETKFSSIRQAVFQIGNPVIKRVLNDTNHTLIMETDSVLGFQYKLMKQHAILTNRVAELTYREYLGKEIPDLAVTASTLHNAGRFVTELGASELPHDEVGGDLLKWWGIPEPIVECAYFHHNPFSASAENHELTGVIHLASHYAGRHLNYCVDELDKSVLERFGIVQNRYEKSVQESLESVVYLPSSF
jgi:DNA-binding response OmpR family regulator